MSKKIIRKKFSTAVVVDAVDLPDDVNDWCCNHDISTHYADSLVLIYRSDSPEKDNLLFKWLIKEGIDMQQYSSEACYYVAIMGT